MSVLHPRWGSPEGWAFTPDAAFPQASEDRATGLEALWQLYVKAAPAFAGNVTVPLLWDTQAETILSTESADIMPMLAHGFAALRDNGVTFYPGRLSDAIDAPGGFIR